MEFRDIKKCYDSDFDVIIARKHVIAHTSTYTCDIEEWELSTSKMAEMTFWVIFLAHNNIEVTRNKKKKKKEYERARNSAN